MPEINPFLMFDDQAEEAARFYTAIFPNSRITKITRYPEGAGPPDAPIPAGTVMTVEFELDGRRFVACNGGPSFSFSQAFSISVQCETQAELDNYWAELTADGGEEVMCGWLTDKFGVSWQINPKRLMEMLSDPDTTKASRAMAALMRMVKIDLDALERAWDDKNNDQGGPS
ncbi:MAG: VOC family protein [Phycisphaerales bacterium]